MAANLGFDGSDLTIIATAISEVARNIVQYAREGEVFLEPVHENGHRGIHIVARDRGPGIYDVDQAMQDGYSTSRGLGLGLPGAKRLMDEFTIESAAGAGTTVSRWKWVVSDGA